MVEKLKGKLELGQRAKNVKGSTFYLEVKSGVRSEYHEDSKEDDRPDSCRTYVTEHHYTGLGTIQEIQTDNESESDSEPDVNVPQRHQKELTFAPYSEQIRKEINLVRE